MHIAMQFNLEIEEVEQAAQQLELWRRDTTSALILEVLQMSALWMLRTCVQCEY